VILGSDVMMKPLVERGYVRRILAGWTGPELDVNAVFARGRMLSPKVRAFVDFLVERLKFDADYMLMTCPAARAEEAERMAAVERARAEEAVAV
jgi:hypothetical protein